MAFDFLRGGSPGYGGGVFNWGGGGAQTNVFGELDPAAVALFAMADRLAQAGAPSPVRQSTFGALASSLLPAAQAYGATQRSNMASAYQRTQLEELKRQQEQRLATQKALQSSMTPGAGIFAQLPPEVQALARANPEFAQSILTAAAQKQFKDNTPIKVGADETLYDPITKQPIFTGPGKPDKPTGDLALIASVYPPGSPEFVREAKRLLAAKATPPAQGQGGPFGGTGMDAQVMNILLTGDPASPQYAAAYNYMAAPKQNIDPRTGQIIEVVPDMSAFRRPGATAQAGAMPAPSPQGTGAQPPATAATAGLPNLPQPGQGQGATPPGSPGVTVRNLDVPARPSAQDLTKMKQITAEAGSIVSALEDFKQETKTATPANRAGAFFNAGGNRLNTKFNISALMAKGEALFNLGVLNGPDLDIIRRTITDPSTMAGAITSPEAYAEQIDIIQNFLKDRVAAYAKANNLPIPDIAPPKVPQSGAGGWSIKEVPEGK